MAVLVGWGKGDTGCDVIAQIVRGDEMAQSVPRRQITMLTLTIGEVGLALGWLISALINLLLRPAIVVSIARFAGASTAVDPKLRVACFVVVGVTFGAGFDQDTHGAVPLVARKTLRI